MDAVKKILIVGSNPSRKSINPTEAFDNSTKSGRTLKSWLIDIDNGINIIHICNLYNEPTDKNKALNKVQIEEGKKNIAAIIADGRYDKIVTIGKAAYKALSELGYDCYEMPHPSGLNRLLNDPEYIKIKIEGLKAFIDK